MRAIDADALKKDLTRFYDNEVTAKQLIDEQPTIEPRKKGKWIDNHTTCSECGWQMIDDVIESPNIVAFNFCPNCGADMRKDGEEDDKT